MLGLLVERHARIPLAGQGRSVLTALTFAEGAILACY